jgi:hypothetical protein
MAQIDLPAEFRSVTDASEIDDAGARRSYRAHTEEMLVLPHIGHTDRCVGMYTVHSESGEEYAVDVAANACSCPDQSHNDPAGGCKHIRRVKLEVEETALPGQGDDVESFYNAVDARRAGYVAKVEEMLERFTLLQDHIRTIDDWDG